MCSKKKNKSARNLSKIEVVIWKSKRLGMGQFSLRGYWSLKHAFFIRIIVLAVFSFILSGIDLFGLASLSEFHSKSLFYQWTAHQYAGSDRNDVTVVMLRDESFEGSWPVSYMIHAEILNEIARYKPKAVFMDFAFIDNRDEDALKEELIPAIQQYRSKYPCRKAENGCEKPPIYLSAIQSSNDLPNGILPRLWKTNAKIVSVLPEDSENRGLTYRATPNGNEVEFIKNQNIPLAVAFEMYNDTQPRQAFEIDDMELVWRLHSTPKQNNGPYKCSKECSSVWSKIFQRLIGSLPESSQVLIGYLFPAACVIKSEIRQQCPPFQTVDAFFLLNGVPENDSEKDDPLSKVLSNKFVFYGADLDAIDDDVLPPTHESIPGVYFHAMALDNLLTYGNNYIRHTSSSISNNLFYFICILLVTCCNELYLLVLQGVNRKKSGKLKIDKNKSIINEIVIDLMITLIYVSICFFIITAASYINFFWLHMSPFDFVGLIAFTGIRFTPRFIRSIDTIGKKFTFYRILFNN